MNCCLKFKPGDIIIANKKSDMAYGLTNTRHLIYAVVLECYDDGEIRIKAKTNLHDEWIGNVHQEYFELKKKFKFQI